MSKSGLDYLFAAVQRGDITGEIVFYEWDGRKQATIIKMDVVDVVAKLKDIPPREGKWGPFWLFYRDGTPVDDDNYVPF